MESTSPNHYNFYPNNLGYSFTTANESIYQANFQTINYYDNPLINEIVYIFSFYPVENRSRKYDPLVERTLVNILFTFFEKNPEKALIFVCDTNGDLHRPRKITFNKWFNKYNTSFEKYNYEIPTEETIYYASLIIHPENSYKNLLIQESEIYVHEVSK